MSTSPQQYQLALKYRPQSFDRIIGHETHVSRLKGIVKSNKIPTAFLFLGPSSAGKTTLARALAVAINGKLGPDVKEMNAADQRGIEDMRELVKLSRLRPMHGKKRIFIIDEAQQLVTNAQAAPVLLKPIEEPSPDTVWIFCSMDPTKFQSGNGRAIANRCVQFALAPHEDADLLKQALRIVKGEGMDYMFSKGETKEEKYALLQAAVDGCNGEMRTLANILQAAQQYYDGLDDPPKRLKKSDMAVVLSTGQSGDDVLAARCMAALYTCQFAKVQRTLLDVENGFYFVTRLLNMAAFVLNATVLGKEKHRKVWWTKDNSAVFKVVTDAGLKLGQIAMVYDALVQTKAQAQSFAVSPEELLSSNLYRLIKQLSASLPKKD